MRLVNRVNRQFANPLAFASRAGYQVHSYQLAAGLSDSRGQLAEGLLAGIEFDADGDAVLG